MKEEGGTVRASRVLCSRWWGLFIVCAVLAMCPAARAGQVVGDIQVVYYAPNSFNFTGGPLPSTLDAPAFIIENTSSSDILSGVLSIGVGDDNHVADSFNVGTIAAHSYTVIVPGFSNDGATHPSGGLFAHTGSPLDTSESGPHGDNVPFSFTATTNGHSASTGTFTPAATAGPSNDGNVSHINFLGANDDSCNNCFGPKVVAQISLASVPEPASWLLLGAGATTLVILGRIRPRRRHGH
jgi:hypothetical protein